MLAFLGPGGVGFWELIIILAIVMIFFGSKRIPELARGLGKGINEFKKGLNEGPDPSTPPAADAKKQTEDTQKPV